MGEPGRPLAHIPGSERKGAFPWRRVKSVGRFRGVFVALDADNGGSADLWLKMQAAYDLWHTRQASAAKLKGIKQVRALAVEAQAAN